MKLVRIEHPRCHEILWGEETYVFAPDDWDEDDIWEHAFKAQKTYLDYLQSFMNIEGPEKVMYLNTSFYNKYPDKTVSEVKKIFEEKKQKYEEWDNKRKRAKYPFTHFLIEEGFQYISDNIDTEIELSWGHRHGTDIDYGSFNIKDVKL